MAHSLYDISPLLPLIERGCSLLTPNVRLARRLKLEWDAWHCRQGAQWWQPPPVYPLEQWLLARWEDAVRAGRVAPRVLLDRAQVGLRWQQVIEDAGGGAALSALLRPAAAAELAAEARDRLLRWRVNCRAAPLHQYFTLEQDCAAFLGWLDVFERDLAGARQCTAADALLELAAVAPGEELPAVALVECGDITPLEQLCLERHCGTVEAVAAPAREGEALLHDVPDERAELELVAAWAAARQRADPEATVGIVLTGSTAERTALEYLLRREFDCLAQAYHSLPVNFSAGIPLAHAPLVRDALLVLATGLERLAVSDVEALLYSRFVTLPDRDSALARQFVRTLYDGAIAEPAVAALRNHAGAMTQGEQQGLALGHCLLAMQRLRALRGQHLPSAWAGHFNAVLDVWGWPGSEPLDTLEYQQVGRWEQTLDRFRALDGVSRPLHYAAALALLREICADQLSQPQTPDSPVQVLGPLEAVGLQFDHLWLCGLQAGAWPAAPRPNPFIPLRVQIDRHMPHASAARQWAFAEDLLGRYRRACGTLHASYSRAREGIPELPSELLAGFVPVPAAIEPGAASAWRQRQADGQREWLADDQAPPLDSAALAHPLGGAGLLEDQSQCPFRAFAARRLKVAPRGAFMPGITPLERGNIVHEALHALWLVLAGRAELLALPPAQREAHIERAVAAGLARLPVPRRHAVGAACIDLESARLGALLREWLDKEAQRGEFRVQALEADVALTLAGLPLTLRVDRIDRLEDGSSIIIDYKTGRAKIADWLGERPRKPQLPLYALASEEPPGALAFAEVRPGESQFAGVGEVEGVPGVRQDISKAVHKHCAATDWPALQAAWRTTLERLATAFIDGDARVDPLRNACQWCGLQPLCRVDSDMDDALVEEAGE